MVLKEVNAETLVPKKQNQDLKRDLQRRMVDLERQTKQAIVELVKARLGENSVNVEEED